MREIEGVMMSEICEMVGLHFLAGGRGALFRVDEDGEYQYTGWNEADPHFLDHLAGILFEKAKGEGFTQEAVLALAAVLGRLTNKNGTVTHSFSYRHADCGMVCFASVDTLSSKPPNPVRAFGSFNWDDVYCPKCSARFPHDAYRVEYRGTVERKGRNAGEVVDDG